MSEPMSPERIAENLHQGNFNVARTGLLNCRTQKQVADATTDVIEILSCTEETSRCFRLVRAMLRS